MASGRDSFHRAHPKVNEGLRGSERPSETRPAARGATGSPTALSAQLVRLARRLGRPAEELAAQIPEDTLRRLKYPLLESMNEDGTRSYAHDPGIVEARKSLLHA